MLYILDTFYLSFVCCVCVHAHVSVDMHVWTCECTCTHLSAPGHGGPRSMSRMSLCCSFFSFSVHGSQSKPEAADSSSSAVSLLWDLLSLPPRLELHVGPSYSPAFRWFSEDSTLLHILFRDCITTAPPPSLLNMLFQTGVLQHI